ncbi:CapA family protein [Rhizobium sp. XQZ8]|uniref:CapA family protein n=1 Tax=Rhizobium populisoli TaxID=2859785 RepID=UPI001CA56E4D|nr:CapA family protein [Rhizobium populisoli]MBW6425846.1 CapA family protein [Rhizobium populisoli]
MCSATSPATITTPWTQKISKPRCWRSAVPRKDHYPTDYAIRLAHELIDNGLVVHGQGNHTMQGIEIYKGRPIFSDLGNRSTT